MFSGSIVTDAEAHQAASRIQAHYRSKRQRSQLQGKLKEDAKQPGPAAAGVPRSSEPGPADGPVRLSRTSCISAAQYSRLRSALEANPTRWPPKLQSLRITTYIMLEEPRSSRSAQVLSTLTLVFILASIMVFMLETMPELRHVSPDVWLALEVLCTLVFTVEFLVRLLVCDVNGKSVWKFLRAPLNVIDLIAILPFYLWLCMQSFSIVKALGILRTVRLVRLFRIFKLGRYSSGLQLMVVALRNSAHALGILSFFLGIGVVLFSSLIYYVEKMGCPTREELQAVPLGDGSGRTQLDHYIEQCHSTPFESTYGLCCDEHNAPLDFPTIIEACWWSIVTMTTVGFGDVGPKTTLGRLVGTATMLSGILLIALPIAIIGRKFQEAYDNYMQQLGYKKDKDGIHASQQVGCLTLATMSRRLKVMRFPDSGMTNLARKLAINLEEVSAVHREIISMQKYEAAKQEEAIEHFNIVAQQLCALTENTTSSRAKFVTGTFANASRFSSSKAQQPAAASTAAPEPQPATAAADSQGQDKTTRSTASRTPPPVQEAGDQRPPSNSAARSKLGPEGQPDTAGS